MAKTEEGTKIDFLGGNNEARIGGNSLLIEHAEEGEGVKRGSKILLSIILAKVSLPEYCFPENIIILSAIPIIYHKNLVFKKFFHKRECNS